MPQIQLLDEATIEKIAAGEVVERPSSVVKELVENAIDAKATFITVEIKEGGLSFIRITDNGCGIDKDQIRLAFLRHSTSKIRSLEDLLCIKSLGFRGEALASISAVAQVELITRPRGALTGVRYVIEGSKEKTFEEIGAPEGTTFLVRNLFFNTPVRRKFLKSAQTEAGYVATIVERLALSHPEVSFQLIVNNQQKLHTSGNCNRKDIIYHIYGKDIASNLLQIEQNEGGVGVSGYIGKPLISRGNRNFENYYINGRYMKSQIVAKAIEEAYKPYLMNHQYPFTVLYLTMDEELMDVNVHPTKMEVRFANGEQLYQTLLHMLREVLQGRDLVPEVTAGAEKSRQEHGSEAAAEKPQAADQPTRAPQPFERNRLSEIRRAVAKDSPYERKYAPRPLPEPKLESKPEPGDGGMEPAQTAGTTASDAPKEIQKGTLPGTSTENLPVTGQQLGLTDIFREENGYQTGFIEQAKRSNIHVIGQLFDTYWLTQADDKLYIMDQHAAHEKVLFERNMKTFASREYTSQQLSPPMILSLSMQEEQALKQNLPELQKLGFEIEEFGGREYSVLAIPDNLYNLDARNLFLELLDDMVSETGTQVLTTEMIWNKVATASCKAAIKGNQRISAAEAETLIQELLTLDNPYHCPHGRPTMISMSKYEIEKKFKRVL